jgi:hypothetical protein
MDIYCTFKRSLCKDKYNGNKINHFSYKCHIKNLYFRVNKLQKNTTFVFNTTRNNFQCIFYNETNQTSN